MKTPLDISLLERKFEFDIGYELIFEALLEGGKKLRELRWMAYEAK